MLTSLESVDVIPALSIPPFQATPTGLRVLSDNVPYEVWEAYGMGLQRVGRALHFVIGDWLNYGEAHYGEMYTQAIDIMPFTYGTLRNDKWVASKVPLSLRNDRLSWNHHYAVANVEEPEKQESWLRLAEQEKWSTRELQQHMHISQGDCLEDDFARALEKLSGALSEALSLAPNDEIRATLLQMGSLLKDLRLDNSTIICNNDR